MLKTIKKKIRVVFDEIWCKYSTSRHNGKREQKTPKPKKRFFRKTEKSKIEIKGKNEGKRLKYKKNVWKYRVKRKIKNVKNEKMIFKEI